MPSLAKCLDKSKAKIPDAEKEYLKKAASDMEDRGYQPAEANETAVRDRIAEMETDRENIVNQINTIMVTRDKLVGKAFRAAKPAEHETVVLIDPRRLMAHYLEQGDPFAGQLQREVNAAGNNMPIQVKKIDQAVKSGKSFESPRLFMERSADIVEFEDGRHRVLWASMLAAPEIPVVTSRKSLENLKPFITQAVVEEATAAKPATRKERREEAKRALNGKDIKETLKDVEAYEGVLITPNSIYGHIGSINPGLTKESIDQMLYDRWKDYGDIQLIANPNPEIYSEEQLAGDIFVDGQHYMGVVASESADYTTKELMTALTEADATGNLLDYVAESGLDSTDEVAYEMGRVALNNSTYNDFINQQLVQVRDELHDANELGDWGKVELLEPLLNIYQQASDFVRSYQTGANTPAYLAAQEYKNNTRPITDKHLRRALLNKKYERRAYRPAEAGITLEQVQKIFPGQQVAFNQDGDIAVKTRSGRGVVIKTVDTIDVDQVAFHVAYGRMDSKNDLILGKYHDGVIEIRRDSAGNYTLAHESYHFMEDAGIITDLDVDVLSNKIEQLHAAGKWKPANPNDVGGAEDRANFVAQNLTRRMEVEKPIQRVLNKIADWIDRFMNLFTRTSGAVIRDIETGNIYGNIEGAEGIAEYPAYQATAWHGSGAFFKKFLSRFVGTGERVNAFGWGFYFSAVRGIARHYADKLGRGATVYNFKDGKTLNDLIPDEQIRKDVEVVLEAYDSESEVVRALENRLETLDNQLIYQKNQLDYYQKRQKGIESVLNPEAKEIYLSVYPNEFQSIKSEIKKIEKSISTYSKILDKVKQGVEIKFKPGRNLYQVTLWKGKAEGTDYNLIDWYELVKDSLVEKVRVQANKERLGLAPNDPLFKDTADLKQFLDDRIAEFFTRYHDRLTGEVFYKAIETMAGNPKKASEFLKRAGIDGIRYPTETLSGGPRRTDIVGKVGGLSPFEAETLAAQMNEMGFSGFDMHKDGKTLLAEMKLDLAFNGDPNEYRMAMEELGWIQPKYNYVVFDENDISIEQVEQYQAVKPDDLAEADKKWLRSQPDMTFASWGTFKNRLRDYLGVQGDYDVPMKFQEAFKAYMNRSDIYTPNFNKKRQPKPPDKLPQYMAKTDEDKQFEEDHGQAAKDFNKEEPSLINMAWRRVGNYWKTRKQNWKDVKPDTNVAERILSLPTHYFQKIPQLKKLLHAGLARADEYQHLINQQERLAGGDSFIKMFDNFRKKNKTAYKKIKGYLIGVDDNQNGFRVMKYKEGQTSFWGVMDRNGKRTGIKFTGKDAEVQAVRAMIAMEVKDLIDNYKFTPEMAKMVGHFRAVTNNGFNILVENIRNIMARYAKAKRKMPKAAYFDGAEKVMVDLQTALAVMGDLRGSYFPRIRKPGRFTVYATKKGTNPILQHFDSKIAANDFAAQMQTKGYQVDKRRVKKLPEDVFEMAGSVMSLQAHINAALDRAQKDYEAAASSKVAKSKVDEQLAKDLKKLMQELELSFASAISEQVANQIKMRGVRVHMIGRNQATGKDVWKGYEEDPVTALAKYVRGVAAGEAKRRMSFKMLRSITGTDVTWDQFKARQVKVLGTVPEYADYVRFVRNRRLDERNQPNAYKDGTLYMSDMLRNDEFIDRFLGQVRGVAVLKYLAGRIAAPFVNLTALPTSTVAAMNGFGNIPINKAFRYLGKGGNLYYRYSFGKKALNPEEKMIMDHIIDNGWHEAQYNTEALSVLKSKWGRGWDKLIDISMYLFGLSERINRSTTIAGTFMGLRDQRMDQWNAATGKAKQALFEKWMAEAKKISDDAHGVYGKVNRPHYARGPHAAARIAQSFYVFKTFSHNYMNTMYRLGFKQPKAFAWMIASPAILAGVGASVATPLINPIVGAIMRALGLAGGEDPEEYLYEKIEENFGDRAGMLVRHGVFGATLGVATKGSLAIGVTDLPTNIKDFLGAPYSMLEDIVIGAQHWGRGDAVKGLEKMMPNFVGSVLRGVREWQHGLTTRTNAPIFYGTEPVKLTLTEALIRAASFNPARIATIREKQWKESEVERRFSEMRTDIYARIKNYFNDPPSKRSETKWLDLINQIDTYNRRVELSGYDYIPYITNTSVKSNLRRAFRPSRKERMRE